jgi:hypothetical protein
MSEEKTESRPRVAWSTMLSTIVIGLLLAAFTYGFSLLATYVFSDRADVYFVERPVLENGKFQKVIVVDNFSSNVINDLQFTITAENAVSSAPVNVGNIEQSIVAPRTSLIKISSILPNRQASFILQSDLDVPAESFRFVKGPIGVRYKSKDKIYESWFDGSQLISALIQFLIYVLGMWYLERRISNVRVDADELKSDISKMRNEDEKNKSLLAKLQQNHLRNKLGQIRRIMNLTKENRLWREVALGVLQRDAKDQNAAKKLLSIILKKAGIRPPKTIEDMDDEELLEALQEAKSELAISQV